MRFFRWGKKDEPEAVAPEAPVVEAVAPEVPVVVAVAPEVHVVVAAAPEVHVVEAVAPEVPVVEPVRETAVAQQSDVPEPVIPAPVRERALPEQIHVPAPEIPEPVREPGVAEQRHVPQPAPVSVVEPTPAPQEQQVLGRMARLRGRLGGGFGRGVLGVLGGASLSDGDWDDAEALLLQADLGIEATQRVMSELKRAVREHGDVSAALRSLLLRELRTERSLELDLSGEPAVVMVVGVNGTGKTTTCGKLAAAFRSMDRAVVLAAADTYRAAAAEQLTTWGSRIDVPVVRGAERADPASVAFDAVQRGVQDGADVVIIDTAGRLHTKVGLMDELGKVRRVIEKVRPVQEVLLVLDATTGQNGLVQARVFAEAVQITGVVLTKLDGTAKGGIVFAVQRELGVPVKFVGLGEGVDDLAPFDAEVFAESLIA